MDYENKTIKWKPLSEYNGGRVLATNDLDLLIGEINSDGDCISEDESVLLCGITAFADIDDIMPKPKNMTLFEEVKNHLENASPEQLEQEWKEMEQFDNCGPLVKDFLCGIKKRNRFMKTIEEKAKAYDETIEKLRDFYRDYDIVSSLIDVKEELANLIPELKESEDERIRKHLIRHFQHKTKQEWNLNIRATK